MNRTRRPSSEAYDASRPVWGVSLASWKTPSCVIREATCHSPINCFTTRIMPSPEPFEIFLPLTAIFD